jgi:predicted pyridoxine 5'-phosphate oxidase superfamily flavin-nucleotide-binding protein
VTVDEPFHRGELAVQARSGVGARMEEIGRRIVRDFMPDEHRGLFADLPFLVIGSLDDRDRPWASIVCGPPGFASSPDARTLAVGAPPLAGDPLGANAIPGAPVGVLGIQLETRRRNRMNGRLEKVSPDGFSIRVAQSFGNCPQYIQARAPVAVAAAAEGTPRREGAVLSARAAGLVRRADTFFVATASADARSGAPPEGIDVSHRGGRPGFVRVTEESGRSVLTAPDFRGNFLFNTLGNLLVNPHAGITVLDFESGDLLLLTGRAAAIWDGAELAAFEGAQRLVRFELDEGILLERAVALRWSAPELARQLDATGSWDDVAGALR